MKNRFYSLLLTLFVITLASCEYDNQEPPKSTLTGKVVYNGQQIGVRSGSVRLELRQPGPQYVLWKTNKLDVNVAQDGTFSAQLFNGNYKLTRVPGNGPWTNNTDTINVEVKGSAMVEVPVVPFFMIKNQALELSGNNINATFKLDQIDNSRALERVYLYLSTTTLVDQNNNLGNPASKAASAVNIAQPITLNAALPDNLGGRSYVYARLAAKTVGIQEMVYSEPVKITLK